MTRELEKIYNILCEFLGESKSGFDPSNMQYQFPCPRCIDNKGPQEARKYNLECNLSRGLFNCWSCSSEGDDMKGTISKLIRQYGNETLLAEYKSLIASIKESSLYKLKEERGEMDIKIYDDSEDEIVKLPTSLKKFKEDDNNSAFRYLKKRGIDMPIIERYGISYTDKNDDNKKLSYRIIVPSFDRFDNLSYFVGRDYIPNSKRLKYMNPKVDKKNVIFNEKLIQWDADITLVEGVFDHIVVPNSIPLLGKALNKGYKLYWDILEKANANVNIMLDGDAFESAMKIYSLLNHGKLYNKIKLIPMGENEDPSSVYQEEGWKGVAKRLSNARHIKDVYLN